MGAANTQRRSEKQTMASEEGMGGWMRGWSGCLSRWVEGWMEGLLSGWMDERVSG